MRELIIDNFAGGGGASTGIELALGRSVDIAINHDEAAIAMHKVNHPRTKHYLEDVWEVDPLEATQGRPVGLAWFSPDCKHFSKAKGGKPVEKSIRGLAWVAVKWAKAVRPRVIILENVEEFKTWGPLTEDNYPDPKRKGETFNLFIRALKKLGYKVDFRELKACDYGAPTIRKRFFMVARCDGRKIIWPEPTHGDPDTLAVRAGILEPWRTAAECIDWSIACPSIFERKKPLAENTVQRITRGINKFVLENPRPFIMQAYGGGYTGAGSDIDRPLPTITATDHNWLVTPFLSQYHSYDDTPRGQTMDRPLLTQDTSNRYGLVACYLTKFYKTGIGQDLAEPLHTVTTSPGHFGEIRAFLTSYYGNESDIGQSLDEPLRTITVKDRFGDVSVKITKVGKRNDLKHWPKVREMLNQYCGFNIASDEILLLEISGDHYFINDIGLRMLVPHELFAAQGFPRDYIIDRDENGKPFTKKDQVAKCGNAVCPDLAKALVSANLPELYVGMEDGDMDEVAL